MVYNYTKPRGPIAAMFNSPGPCYGLPTLVGHTTHDPRSTHVRGPQWTLAKRIATSENRLGPGPCYKPESNVFNTGKSQPVGVPIVGRPKDYSLFTTPGPGAYSSENGDKLLYNKPPEYSIGQRFIESKTSNTPGD